MNKIIKSALNLIVELLKIGHLGFKLLLAPIFVVMLISLLRELGIYEKIFEQVGIIVVLCYMWYEVYIFYVRDLVVKLYKEGVETPTEVK